MPDSYLEILCSSISVLGLVSILWSVYRWRRATPVAIGWVRCIEKRYNIEGASYAPIVEFDWHGERITLENLPGSPWRPRIRTGEKVPLYFSPSYPGSAKLSPVSTSLVFMSMLAIVGGIVIRFFVVG